MRTNIKVKLVRKMFTAEGMAFDDANAFLKLVPSGSLETTEAIAEMDGLPEKQKKELRAVLALARTNDFPNFLAIFGICGFSGEFEVEILSDGDDPPDAILKVGASSLKIEITDFPPNQAPLLKVIEELSGSSPWPTLHEVGRNPKAIKQFMAAPASLTEPRSASVDKEVAALHEAAIQVVSRKDEARCSDILLLHGPAAFSYPEEEVIDAVVCGRRFVSLKGVVFVKAQGCRVWSTNLSR